MVVRINKNKKKKKKDSNKALEKKTKVSFKLNKHQQEAGNNTKNNKRKDKKKYIIQKEAHTSNKPEAGDSIYNNNVKQISNEEFPEKTEQKTMECVNRDQQSSSNVPPEVNQALMMEDVKDSEVERRREANTKYLDTQGSSDGIVENSVMESSLNTEIKNQKGINLVVDLNLRHDTENYHTEEEDLRDSSMDGVDDETANSKRFNFPRMNNGTLMT
ncbi:uncharacterized protein [Solanum tuberosum]|uniref:uncharacterized protein n=1 Tax=Solanum tuberosum TaxID=4113 RepID=UPI00073A2C51|nr:PREDICTED: uncharacterized protein LOC107061892 [Solanum tuberosum]